MERLIDKLIFRENKSSFIDELKDSQLPILLYGGGSYARDVLKYLKEHGVVIDMVFADEVLQDILDDYDLKRISIDEIDFPCYVVMGFAKYLMGQALAERNDNIRKIYYPVLMPYDETEGYTKETVMELLPEYQKTYELLEDDLSRECMAGFLNSRVNEDAQFCFGCFEKEQTYFKNSVFEAVPDENYLDIGAYTGDTIRLFAKEVGGAPNGHIWAIEADKTLESVIRTSIEESGVADITELYMAGLWDEKKTIYFNKIDYSDEEGFISDEKGANRKHMDVDTLDNVMAGRECNITLLKVNFCNAAKILRGGVNTIKKDRPKIAVVVAFGSKMIAEIPALIKAIDPNYRVYLRFNSPMPARIVCYAVCKS